MGSKGFINYQNHSSRLTQGPHIIQSFDIFDTLIARKCVHPTNIFLIVEKKSGIEGFAEWRIKSEATLRDLESDYKFDQIYDLIQKNLKVNDQVLKTLKESEMTTELENAIPITCNIKKITRSSILITDMYYDDIFIRELLYTAGINIELPIIKTSFGKSRGYVWDQLIQNGVQCRHLGDSIHSDVEMARKFGMRADYSPIANPNILESKLSDSNLYQLACSFREARLRYFDAKEESLCESLEIQNLLNIPLILYFAAYIVQTFALNGDKTKFVFASRDCRLLHHAVRIIMSKLQSQVEYFDTRYWLTSRQSRVYGSNDYLQYCDELARGEECLFVDLVGTGASMQILRDRLNQIKSKKYTSEDFFVAQFTGLSAKEELSRRYNLAEKDMPVEQGTIKFALSWEKTVNNLWLEMMNYTPEGMLRDVIKIQDSFVPWRDQCDMDDFQQNLALLTQSYSLNAIESIINSYDGTIYSFMSSILSGEYIGVIQDMCNEVGPFLEHFARTYFLGAHVSNEDFIDFQNNHRSPT